MSLASSFRYFVWDLFVCLITLSHVRSCVRLFLWRLLVETSLRGVNGVVVKFWIVVDVVVGSVKGFGCRV